MYVSAFLNDKKQTKTNTDYADLRARVKSEIS